MRASLLGHEGLIAELRKIARSWIPLSALPTIDNTVLADMAQATIKGRASGAGTGDPTDLTAAQVRTIVASTTPTASTIPLGDGSGHIDDDWLADGGIALAKMAGAGNGVVWRSTITGVLAPVGLGTQSILARKGTGDNVAGHFVGNQCVVGQTTGDIINFTASASQWLGRLASGDLGFKTMANLIAELEPEFRGTSFPAAVWDGRPFYRTDLACGFHFDDTTGGWLSEAVWGFEFGYQGDLAATNFVRFNELVGSQLFSTTLGWPMDFPCKVVGMDLMMAASGTCTVQVGNGAGGAVTGATLALSSVQSKADNAIMSDTIAANSLLTVAVVSGTLEGPARGKFWIRRFEEP